MRSVPALLLSFSLLACGGAAQTRRAETAAPAAAEAIDTESIVPFASEASMRRLARSQHKVDFFKLANHFEGQQNRGMCGPTTSVIVLNALRADADEAEKPSDPTLYPEEYAKRLPDGFDPLFRRYTQGVFFDDERVTGVKKRATFYGLPTEEGKRDPGLQLRQLHEILSALGLKSELRVVTEELDIERIRRELRENLTQPDDYVIINYHRPALDQPGGGHISPLGAYDARSDSFLILDVNPNGKTWVWVPTEKLVGAMRTFDTIENRGYLLVRD